MVHEKNTILHYVHDFLNQLNEYLIKKVHNDFKVSNNNSNVTDFLNRLTNLT